MSVISNQSYDLYQQMKAGSYGPSGDVIAHTLYDSAVVATTGIQSFFINPISGTKTLAETNMRDTGKLAAGQSFVIQKLRLSCITQTKNAVEPGVQVQRFIDALAFCNIQLSIAGREFDCELHANQFLPSLAWGTATANYSSVYTITQPVYRLNQPITLGELVSFKLNMNFDTAGNGVSTALTALNGEKARFHWSLIGMLARRK